MNVRTVRNKIKSVSNVKKITRAMQLVSAVKMKKAQELALAGQPYQEVLKRVMSKISSKVDTKISSLLGSQSDKKSDKKLIILVTSNKGLCGAFNTSLIKFLINGEDFKYSDFILIGKKGERFISRIAKNIVADFSSPTPMNSVTAVIELAIQNFLSNKYNSVLVYYNKFVSTLRVDSQVDQLLPIIQPKTEELEEKEEYLIEPQPEEIIDEVLRAYVEERLRHALMQTEAGEHSSRMIAMKNATDNANELIYNLTLLRNKLRQQKITYELLDMITAKESVEIT